MEIHIKNLCKSYDGEAVLDNVNMSFYTGRPVCIMAPSGKGKTTLMNIILGLIRPDSGVIEKDGNMLFSAVFQEDRLCEDLSAVMNTAIVQAKPNRPQIEKALIAMGLEKEEISRPVKTLSGGQKRRVAISRRLCAQSHTVIMDEPFKGLDEDTRRQVIKQVKEKSTGKILIVITHDERDAADLRAETVKL